MARGGARPSTLALGRDRQPAARIIAVVGSRDGPGDWRSRHFVGIGLERGRGRHPADAGGMDVADSARRLSRFLEGSLSGN